MLKRQDSHLRAARRRFREGDRISARLDVCAEALEGRTLFAAFEPVKAVIDYRFDVAHFFNTPLKKKIMQAAADVVVSRLNDSLAAISPSGNNQWTATFLNPASGDPQTYANLEVPQDTIVLFVGGSLADDGVLGFSNTGDAANLTGSTEFVSAVRTRGQQNAIGGGATDNGVWGGGISFDQNPPGGWYFGESATIPSGQFDFYSVALHETMHVLGIGPAASWQRLIIDGKFEGAASEDEYGMGGPVPLANGGHWGEGLVDQGQEVAMDPDIGPGERKVPTRLDLAGLDDLGWELPVTATATSDPFLNGQTTGQISVEFSHYRPLSDSAISQAKLTISGPRGYSALGTFVQFAPPGADPTKRTATFQFNAPGGTWDSGDNGQYVFRLNNAVSDGFGNELNAGAQLGVVDAVVAGPPVATLAAETATTLGASTYSFNVNYNDNTGVDLATLTAGDLTIQREDGQALTLVGAPTVVSGSAPGSVTATYTVQAPGGTLDPDDNGAYIVTLNANQVSDTDGNFEAQAVLGQFRVEVGALPFGGRTRATYTDASGDIVTVSLSGLGTGSVLPSATGQGDALRIDLANVTERSSVVINVTGAGTSVGGIVVNGSLKALTGKLVDVTGDIGLAQSAGKIQLRNLTGGTMTVGVGAPLNLTFESVSNYAINSVSAIRSLRVVDWADGDATPDVISASSLDALAVAGNFASDVSVYTIGRGTIRGALTGSNIRAVNSIGGLTVGNVTGSSIYAGLPTTFTGLPASAADFVNPFARIGAFAVKSKSPAGFVDTRIAAPTLGGLALGQVLTANGGRQFGVFADGAVSIAGATDAGGAFKVADQFTARDLVVGDFLVRIV